MQHAKATTPSKSLKKDIYYTTDHEWIDFQGSVAYTGFCSFKRKGMKAIEKIEFAEAGSLFKANDIIGSVYYGEYKIDIHFAVSGRILSFNEALTKGKGDLLITQPENAGWFALIAPASPYEREWLMMSGQYRMKTRSPW
jgi:glycine cleavage system H protein